MSDFTEKWTKFDFGTFLLQHCPNTPPGSLLKEAIVYANFWVNKTSPLAHKLTGRALFYWRSVGIPSLCTGLNWWAWWS